MLLLAKTLISSNKFLTLKGPETVERGREQRKMARSSILRSQVLRQALGCNKLSPAVSCNLSSGNSSSYETLLSPNPTPSLSHPSPSKPFSSISSNPTTATGFRFSNLPFLLSRPFSSSSGTCICTMRSVFLLNWLNCVYMHIFFCFYQIFIYSFLCPPARTLTPVTPPFI